MYTSSFRIGDDDLILETGKIAKQANGSVLARYGGSVVLATTCCSAETTEGLDYVPLMVDYNERYYSAGKIPGGFIKRETRPKDKEFLVSRLIDRPMRPLFDKRFGRDIQVIPMTISTDQIHTPDILGMMAAFASVEVSDIPFNGPLAAIRIGSIDNKLIVNPTFQQIEESELDIVIAGSNNGIVMVEGAGNQISEQLMLEALEHAENVLKELCKYISDFAAAAGKKKLPLPDELAPFDSEEEIIRTATIMFRDVAFLPDKIARAKGTKSVKKSLAELFAAKVEAYGDNGEAVFNALLDRVHSDIMRQSIVKDQKRCDGRSPSEIRPISAEVGLLPRTHGSALFTRGETQSIGVATLGSTYDEQIFDDIDGDRRSSFMLHYNFPPYSVGETGRTGTGRREIGHGQLAQRAIEPVLPDKEEFPYTVRIVSEITESNGSSSMATVCSGAMCLLAAGVPIKAPVAGIAMGLIQENGENVVLSDILGEEDHMGDMDFKVTGSETGITAFQMDIKVSGIGLDVMRDALEKAREGRLHILNEMLKVISGPSERISEYAPIVLTYNIDIDKIGVIIGPGGQNIRNISETSEAKIDVDDQGAITIFARNGRRSAETALNMVKALVEEPELGKIYNGIVKRIVDFGAFIEILPGKEGLCHISRLAKKRVSSVESILQEGQRVNTRLIDVDRMGRYNLSIVDAEDLNWKPHAGSSRPQGLPPRRPRR